MTRSDVSIADAFMAFTALRPDAETGRAMLRMLGVDRVDVQLVRNRATGAFGTIARRPEAREQPVVPPTLPPVANPAKAPESSAALSATLTLVSAAPTNAAPSWLVSIDHMPAPGRR